MYGRWIGVYAGVLLYYTISGRAWLCLVFRAQDRSASSSDPIKSRAMSTSLPPLGTTTLPLLAAAAAMAGMVLAVASSWDEPQLPTVLEPVVLAPRTGAWLADLTAAAAVVAMVGAPAVGNAAAAPPAAVAACCSSSGWSPGGG